MNLFRIRKSRFLNYNYSDSWEAKDACALMLCLEEVLTRTRPQRKRHGAINSVAVRMRFLPSRASKQPILIGQVVYPKTIGKNNSCKSSYPDQECDVGRSEQNKSDVGLDLIQRLFSYCSVQIIDACVVVPF